MSEKSIVDVVKLNLRLPKALHRKLSQAAKANNVSLNTEIINQLEGVSTQVKSLIQATATATADRVLRAVRFGESGKGQ